LAFRNTDIHFALATYPQLPRSLRLRRHHLTGYRVQVCVMLRLALVLMFSRLHQLPRLVACLAIQYTFDPTAIVVWKRKQSGVMLASLDRNTVSIVTRYVLVTAVAKRYHCIVDSLKHHCTLRVQLRDYQID
jgi:predicted neutral ceramidase superfamily lipid hydrolase